MGTFRRSVIANVAGAVIPLLRQPIEDVIYDTLDRRQFPTRSEVRELNTRLEKVQGALDKLTVSAEVAEASLATLRVPLGYLTPPFVTLALPQGDERPSWAHFGTIFITKIFENSFHL